MSHQPKGCMQKIVGITRIPSTSPNKKVKGGGRVILKLACKHEVNARASVLARKSNHSKAKKAQCWTCVAERNADATGEYRS